MPETFRVTIAGRTHTVELDEQEATADGKSKLRAVVDGIERPVDARRLGPGAWSLIVDGEVRLVDVDGAGAKLSVAVSHADGEPRQAAVEVARAGADALAASERASSGPAIVRAPIPGKLVKLLVKAGDRVKAGQTLAVLEAMKMENELRAPRDASVAAVHASEGATVETGQELLSLT
jgi:biotin carboxyl carrier protein